MGTYLSTPVTEKCEESGESLECPDVPCSWGVVDMQGWRKSMEDAHVAVTDIPLSDAEKSDAKVFGVFDGHGGPEVARFCGLYLVSVLTQQQTWKEGDLASPPQGDPSESRVGQALRSAFHALDRMIDDPERREEIINLRNLKPQTGDRRDAISIPEPKEVRGCLKKSTSVTTSGNTESESTDTKDLSASDDSEQLTNNPHLDQSVEGDKKETEILPGKEDQKEPSTETREEVADNDASDDDSNEAVGKEEAAEQDRDMMDENEDGNDDGVAVALVSDDAKPVKVASMFQKILSLGGQGGQVVIKVGGAASEEEATSPLNPLSPSQGPSASKPTIIHNGRMICNLPDHVIHAGATAIVAVITGRTLTVANAGDSRAVLCRAGGLAFPLSFDHKPQQAREMSRITKAGGFVNHFGRVNGNLNLSRSIGDLKYKQVPGISPPEQIITAEPDIVQVALEPDDEFIILGCDGIWDCLTNENAVQYVRERIDSKTPTEIGREMLDEIISEDPRVTQGIGGDNMTIMIIDLQPLSRKGRPGPETNSSSE